MLRASSRAAIGQTVSAILQHSGRIADTDIKIGDGFVASHGEFSKPLNPTSLYIEKKVVHNRNHEKCDGLQGLMLKIHIFLKCHVNSRRLNIGSIEVSVDF